MNNTLKISTTIVLVFLISILTSFKANNLDKKEVIRISGSSTMHGLITEISKVYCLKNNNLAITV